MQTVRQTESKTGRQVDKQTATDRQTERREGGRKLIWIRRLVLERKRGGEKVKDELTRSE